jgi:hypothetical protein
MERRKRGFLHAQHDRSVCRGQVRNLQEGKQCAFTVTNASLATFDYKPADNHDPDGESNGTAITIFR